MARCFRLGVDAAGEPVPIAKQCQVVHQQRDSGSLVLQQACASEAVLQVQDYAAFL